MLKAIIITVLVYSAINTIICIYKDSSSYSMGMEWTDMISGGPVLWLVLGIFIIIRKTVGKKIAAIQKERRKNYEPKLYSKKKIEKIVKKAMKIARNENQKYGNYFLITTWYRDYDGDYEGVENLVPNRERFQFIRKKFSRVYHNQKDLTITEIEKYMVPVTEEVMTANNDNEWYISKYKDKGLMKF